MATRLGPTATNERFRRPGGHSITVIMRTSTAERLEDTCFRGYDNPLAGNFWNWESFREVLDNQAIRSSMLDELDQLYEDDNFNAKYSFSVRCPEMIGWSSTKLRTGEVDEELVERRLNKRATAMFIRDLHLPAPLTDWLTFVCELKMEKGQFPTAIVHSLYPGEDLGELKGDMTERTGRIWFDWENPGTALRAVRQVG